MTSTRGRSLAGLALLAFTLARPTPGHAAGPACPPPRSWPSDRDCPRAIISPPGFPSHGGTITVHPGISAPCVVRLPGGALLCAGGETAWPYGRLSPTVRPHGRAIFRVSGSGPYGPGGLNIVVSASDSDAPTAPELLPRLYADAVVRLPPGTVLVRLDAANGVFVPIPDAHIRLAGDTLYKVVPAGASPTLQAAPPALPATLPATGGGPFGALLALAGVLLAAGLWLGVVPLRRRGADRMRHTTLRVRLGRALLACGALLAAATGLAYAVMGAQPAPAGFGTLGDVASAVPRAAGAAGPPTRLAVPRLGIDTRVLPLGISGGAWQLPSFAAGYLAGGAWPGHNGNEVITGHDDRDGAVFRALERLRPGDVVRVYAGTRSYRYAVTALRIVMPTRVDLLRPTRGAVLTLITCAPYLIDTQRLVARAELVAGD